MSLFSINLFGITISPSIYGLMYALSFIIGFLYHKKRGFFNKNQLDDIFLYVFLGVILGGRLGYTLFYNFNYYQDNLLEILKVWEGGMSFHGGVIGVIIAMIIFSIKKNYVFIRLLMRFVLYYQFDCDYEDYETMLIENYYDTVDITVFLSINVNSIGYFPSTLLEALLEGLVLYMILTYLYRNRKFSGQVASVFLVGYGVFRLIVELFFRQPDAHIGYIIGSFSLGSLLTIPMIIFGIGFYFLLIKK